MKSLVICGLLAFSMGATLEDKLTLKATDTMGDHTSTSSYKLEADGKLTPGEQLTSLDQLNILIMQTDGNLVFFYKKNALWNSGTDGNPGAYALMQSDGNFVVYLENEALWASNTAGVFGAYLSIDDECNLVIYSGQGDVVWSRREGKLRAGDSLSPSIGLTSLDGKTTLRLMDNGLLYVTSNGIEVWNSAVYTFEGCFATMEPSGAFIVKGLLPVSSPGILELWSSNTAGVGGAYLQVQNDTNVVVYSAGGHAAWSWKHGLKIIPGSIDILQSGVTLGSSLCLISPDGYTSLVMQGDGNMVVYNDGKALWSSGTYGNPGAYALMQPDGNAVVYLETKALWNSRTNGYSGAYLQLQDDTNLVVYSSEGKALWTWKWEPV